MSKNPKTIEKLFSRKFDSTSQSAEGPIWQFLDLKSDIKFTQNIQNEFKLGGVKKWLKIQQAKNSILVHFRKWTWGLVVDLFCYFESVNRTYT